MGLAQAQARKETEVTKYCVYTPHYEGYHNEYGSDTVVVDAATKRKALVLGLAKLRLQCSQWVQDQASDGHNPFSGLKAEVLE